eukprot:TRINITY_DN2699_c0_g1_i1.p1 TRINITY_DN2699_c0_g1~~TRINITY_DN2699_c0_g1_i1.p1  ORF type:complete len:2900 (-),score=828.74 TRINITY_DN2699_c0_g1_i1:54-8009(-)
MEETSSTSTSSSSSSSSTSSGFKNITKGERFYSNFKNQVDDHMVQHFGVYSGKLLSNIHSHSIIFRILSSVLERLIKGSNSLSKNEFLFQLLNNIHYLSNWLKSDVSLEDRQNGIQFIKKILFIHPTEVLNNDVGFNFIVEFTLNCLSRGLPLSIKSEVIGLLIPHIFLFSKEHHNSKKKIVQSLSDVVNFDFPTTSSDLPRDSTIYNEYVECINKLFGLLISIKHTEILEVLFPILREDNHCCQDKIHYYLSRFIQTIHDENQALGVFEYCFKSFLDTSLVTSLRLTLLHQLCLPLIYQLSVTSMIQLFSSHIERIMEIISPLVPQNKDDSSMTVEVEEHIIVDRLGAFHLLHTMYSCLSSNIIRTNINDKYHKAPNAKGNELNGAVMRAAHAVKSESVDYLRSSHKLVLEYHCTAYNTLAAVVMCTQTQEKFFTVFCFKIDPEKNEKLWDNIVDTKISYQFESETNFPVANKEVLSLFTTAKESSDKKVERRYISSHYLADSSLSMDALGSSFFGGQKDNVAKNIPQLTSSNSMDEMKIDKKGANTTSNTTSMSTMTNTVNAQTPKESIELDVLNSNPCMITLLKLIELIHQKFSITNTKDVMPRWMKELHTVCVSTMTHVNIKLFITKLIINLPHIFEPYARFWFKIIIQIVLENEFGKSGFNYFVRDICIMFLKWSNFGSSSSSSTTGNSGGVSMIDKEDRIYASKFVLFLMKHTVHHSRSILQSNIQIIKLLVERWKENLILDRKVVYDNLTFDRKPQLIQLCRMTAMQLLGILLSNDFPLYDANVDSEFFPEVKFYDVLLSCLNESKKIFPAAGSLVGLALKKNSGMMVVEQEDDEAGASGGNLFEQMTKDRITLMFKKEDHMRILLILNNIAEHHPSFVINFFPRIFSHLKRFVGEIQVLALKMIRDRLEYLDEVYLNLRPLLIDLLRHREEETQLVTLQIVYGLLPKLDQNEIISFLPTLFESFPNHPNQNSRTQYYQILVWLYENQDFYHRNKQYRLELLRGVTDRNPTISKYVLDFWDHPQHLPEEPAIRMKLLMKPFYYPELESEWLKYSTYLMLNLTSHLPDFNTPLFEPLENSAFREYRIDNDWHLKAVPMTPLFSSQTQSSMEISTPTYDDDTTSSTSSTGISSNDPFGGIRATPAPIFSLTQSGIQGGKSLRNTLMSQIETTYNTNTYNSSMTQNKFDMVVVRSQTQPVDGGGGGGGADFKKPLPIVKDQPMSKLEQQHMVRVQKRFDKTPQMVHSTEFVMKQKALRQRKQEQIIQRERQIKRLHQVQILRQYRQGELPDVQIKLSEMIQPLQILIQRDTSFSRIIFAELALSISQSDADKDTDKDHKLSLFKTAYSQLSHSTGNNSPFINSLLSIIHKECSSSSSSTTMVNPTLVGNVSISSSNYHIGIMLLEKQILSLKDIDDDELNDRQKKFKQEAWHQLARLYRHLGEEDILLGLYENNSKQQLTKDALEAELNGDYASALKIYHNATEILDQGKFNPPPSDWETDLWEIGRLECFVKLTQWDYLLKNTMAEIDNDTIKLWDNLYKDPYLRYYIHSSMNSKNTWNDLWQFLDRTTTQQKEELEKNFSMELSNIYLFKDETALSKFYVNKSYNQFLERWSNLPVLALEARHKLLQKLQFLYEIEEFHDVIQDSSRSFFETLNGPKHMLKRWRLRFPSPKYDGIEVWENLIVQRSTLLEKLHHHVKEYWDNKKTLNNSNVLPTRIKEEKVNNSRVILTEIKETLIKERSKTFLEMAIASLKQSNFSVADKYLRLCIKAKTNQKEFDFIQNHSLVKLYCMKAMKAQPEEAIDMFSKALKFLEGRRNEPEILNNQHNKQKFMLMESKVTQQLYKHSLLHPQIIKESLQKYELHSLLDGSSVVVNLLSSTTKKYREAISMYDDPSSSISTSTSSSSTTSKSTKTSASAFLKFALFCDEIINFKVDISSRELEELSIEVVKMILEAIKRGSLPARSRFPRLLQLIDNPNVGKVFQSKVKEIPLWMTIGWISQVMALLNKPEGVFIYEMLEILAKTYPQAIYFPFSISSENLPVGGGDDEEHLNAKLEPLKNILKNDLLEFFIKALEKLTHPEHRFKDWCDLIKPYLPQKSGQKLEESHTRKIQKLWSEAYEDCFNPKQDGIGSYNKQFAAKWQTKIDTILGKGSSSSSSAKLANGSMDASKFLKATTELHNEMRKDMGRNQTQKQNLTEFSLWLSRFEQTDYSNGFAIELPGQYDGTSKPNPSSHVRVSSFDDSLLVMGSIRKPKRLKFRGNDEKDYPFLVKGGEDLRLDQRVEQLYSVMNQILKNDNQSSKRKLHINTYKVVPMTNRVGIIQWIENTKPLKSIIEQEIAKQLGEKEVDILSIEASKLHNDWIKSFSKGKNVAITEQYYNMFKGATKSDTIKKVRQQEETISWDLLRNGVMALSSCPEAYLLIRSQFARSLAAFSIGSYIIGIGDRHLDNFLLNLSNGEIIGIDFGHAFGTATQFLPIPELMPFRLTRQFTNFLLPLDSEGMLKHNMVHTLDALQRDKEILLTTMDVFVKEPLLDWEKLAQKLASQQGRDAEDEKIWFPSKKIEIAKRKLNMDNPAFVSLTEVSTSIHYKKPYYNNIKSIVLGDSKTNIRARVQEKCASAKQQVDCLVDQATDPNILGRSWGGWAAFI